MMEEELTYVKDLGRQKLVGPQNVRSWFWERVILKCREEAREEKSRTNKEDQNYDGDVDDEKVKVIDR